MLEIGRLEEIERQVTAAGHWYNPFTDWFEPAAASQALPSHDTGPPAFRACLVDVTVDELEEYCRHRRAAAESEAYFDEEATTIDEPDDFQGVGIQA